MKLFEQHPTEGDVTAQRKAQERQERINDEKMRRKKKVNHVSPKKGAVPRPKKQHVVTLPSSTGVGISSVENDVLSKDDVDEIEVSATAALDDLDAALNDTDPKGSDQEQKTGSVASEAAPEDAVASQEVGTLKQSATESELSVEMQERLQKMKDQMARLVALSGKRAKKTGLNVKDARAYSENYDHARKVIEQIRYRVGAIENGATSEIKMEEIDQLESELAQALFDMRKEFPLKEEEYKGVESEKQATEDESSDDTEDTQGSEKLTTAEVYDRYRNETAEVEQRVTELVSAHPELKDEPSYDVYLNKLDTLKAHLVDNETAQSNYLILRTAIESLERDFTDFEHKVLNEGLSSDEEDLGSVDIEGEKNDLPPMELFEHAQKLEESEKQLQQRDRINQKLNVLVTENQELTDAPEYQVLVAQLQELHDDEFVTHEKLVEAADALMELQRVGIAQKAETVRAQEELEKSLVLTKDQMAEDDKSASEEIKREVGDWVIIPRTGGSESKAQILAHRPDSGTYRVTWEQDGEPKIKDIPVEDLRSVDDSSWLKGQEVIVPRTDGSESQARIEDYLPGQDKYVVTWEEDGEKLSKIISGSELREPVPVSDATQAEVAAVAADPRSDTFEFANVGENQVTEGVSGVELTSVATGEGIGNLAEPDERLLQSQEDWRAVTEGQTEVIPVKEKFPRIFGSHIPKAGPEGRFGARSFKDGLLLMRGRVEDVEVQKKIDDVLRIVGYVPDSGLREEDVTELERLAHEINMPESLFKQRYDHIDKMYADVDAQVSEKLKALGNKDGGKKSKGLMGRSTVMRWFSRNKSK